MDFLEKDWATDIAMAMMIAITKIPDNPVIANIPKLESNHNKRRRPTIWPNGDGKILITQSMIRNIKISQIVIIFPLKKNMGNDGRSNIRGLI